MLQPTDRQKPQCRRDTAALHCSNGQRPCVCLSKTRVGVTTITAAASPNTTPVPTLTSILPRMSSPAFIPVSYSKKVVVLHLPQPQLFPSDWVVFVSPESTGAPTVVTASTAVAVTVDKKTAIAAGRSCPCGAEAGKLGSVSRARHRSQREAPHMWPQPQSCRWNVGWAEVHSS